MKEGYLQMKITEFNDKCNQLEQALSTEEAKIRLLQEKVGEYKEVIKKLQDIQEFKHQTILEIRKENESILKNQIEQISKKLSELLTEITTSKTEKINEALRALQNRNEQINMQEESIKQNNKELIFLLEHNEILMMKLVNRKVLSEHDIIEMQRRAAKKAGKN